MPAIAIALGVLTFVAAAQPSAPRGLAAAPGDAEATLSWTDPSNDAITGYSVRYATSAAALSSGSAAWSAISGGDAASVAHTVRRLTNGARYYFQVRATDADGDSPPSNVATTRLAASPTAVVAIDDSGLRTALERSLRVAAGADITQLDLATLSGRLVADNAGISDLTGLEHATNLAGLWLRYNTISDVSALGSLESVTELLLDHNAISDVSVLGSLESLTRLVLNYNEITDISALGSLESLTELGLWENAISDVSVLGSLESLTSLGLNYNEITDVSALGSLESLTELHLGGNAISDVSVLGSLESLTELYLGGNAISDVSVLGLLESLTRLGLENNEIWNVSALGSLGSLTWLHLQNNAISDVSALGSLGSLTWLHLSNNAISDVSALGSLESLTTLRLDDNEISDVSALGSLDSLTELYLYYNAISDVSALGSLESLAVLRLDGNTIEDVSALGSLESLWVLGLGRNEISDVSALGSLQSLWVLELYHNAISDVSALGSLESLGWLVLAGNEISDVSALGSLESLTQLDLSGNAISDVSALGSLESLTQLYLHYNAIEDVSALGSLESLERLDLSGNRIADVTPLVGAGIDVVGLRGNPLSADSIERHVPALRDAGMTVVAGWPVPLFPSAADPLGRQGFVRVVNRSAVGGDVLIDAVDDAGRRFGPLRLAIGAGEAAHFNSQDLEAGNAAKALSVGVGAPTDGLWRLALSSTLDIEVLSYMRTPTGFVTSVHDMLPRQAASRVLWFDQPSLYAAVFNPGSNSAQRSSLRLTNPGGDERMAVLGWDDRGRRRGAFSGSVPAGGAATVDAAALEAGIGDGAGKWRLEVYVRWPVEGVSLLTSPSGLLTNLSTVPSASVNGVWRVPLFPAADSASGREGVVRVINHSWQAGEARVVAVDDGGARVGPLTLTLRARQAVHLNSGDLQRGNAAKGLRDGVGSPTRGDWRLELTSDLDIAVMSYVRAPDGFLTSMHDLAPPGVPAQAVRVPTFNPGSNQQQVGLLRVMNDGDRSAAVRVAGVDSAGMPSGEVRLTVPAGEARTLTAADLEAGDAAFEGALGDGVDKWRLDIASDVPVSVMSLLRSPGGHLTNLSTGTRP